MLALVRMFVLAFSASIVLHHIQCFYFIFTTHIEIFRYPRFMLLLLLLFLCICIEMY
jgi:hypothetical protein